VSVQWPQGGDVVEARVQLLQAWKHLTYFENLGTGKKHEIIISVCMSELKTALNLIKCS